MRLLIIFGLLFVLALAVLMALRSSGPRVTRIEHRRDERDDSGDRKGGDE